jgi:hypothetical protein
MEIGSQYFIQDYADMEEWLTVQRAMNDACMTNGWSLEEGEDAEKGYFLVIREIPAPSAEELLATAKTAKLAELKSIRDTKEVEPIEVNGSYFDYDEKARDRINAAIIALDSLGDGASLEWTTADNQDVTVTANILRAVIATVAKRSNELHTHYRELKTLVEEAKTAEEVEPIQW